VVSLKYPQGEERGSTSGFSQGKTLQSALHSKAAAHRYWGFVSDLQQRTSTLIRLNLSTAPDLTLQWAYQRILAGKNSAISSS
jgi:hypothetical protein